MAGFDPLGFPHCIGAITGTHIPLIGPAKESAECYNWKCMYSVLLQGLTDHSGRFLDIEVGSVGVVKTTILTFSGIQPYVKPWIPDCLFWGIPPLI